MAAFTAVSSVEVARRAAEINPVRVLLMILAFPFLALGWIVGWTWRIVWLVLSWSLAAAEIGWKQSQASRDDPRSGRGAR